MSDVDVPPTDRDVSRRSFLKWATVILGSSVAAVLGGIGGGYFLSPLFKKNKEDWIDIGGVKNFPPGVPTKVDYV